jgi:ABC-2 type transport system ATP-binding protein
MIEVTGLTKRYGKTVAVDHLGFTVRPGLVTGFLGPNGSGKSTTLRMILGLDRPDEGRALIDGIEYVRHPAPLRSVGALLDASEVHAGRRASAHLLSLAVTIGEGRRRVDEVLATVGLEEVADRRLGTFSLGMAQRLGIAAALLGDPAVVVLDEPVNGLDPDGVVWIRHLMRKLADEGRTVLVSSHLMAEMAQTADHVVVIGRGRLLADVPITSLLAGSGTAVVLRSPELSRLLPALDGAGGEVVAISGDRAELRGVDNVTVAEAALRLGVTVHELYRKQRTLEQAFMELTHDERQFTGALDNPQEAAS